MSAGGWAMRIRSVAAPGVLLLGIAVAAACEPVPVQSTQLGASPLADSDFAQLISRISEPGGYFDTDNLISNEGGYLKVMDALEALGLEGGAYVGVGPDQNYSYIAQLRPDIVFMTDVRRDNMLHHLLLKALIERAETRVEFLAGLHGRVPPDVPAAWADSGADEVMAYVDGAERLSDLDGLRSEVAGAIAAYGLDLSEADYSTISGFHQAFIDAGPSLRFTSFGRPPRWYYPTYRELAVETDLDGDQVSYLASADRYSVVRDLHIANKIVPVVGDMSGPSALREMGVVMREMGVELRAFYTSNVEFYLWRGSTFDDWEANLASMPVAEDAVIIRSYFPNAGGAHPSAVPGYYSTQTLQPVGELLAGGYRSYWDVVTQGVIDLRVGR